MHPNQAQDAISQGIRGWNLLVPTTMRKIESALHFRLMHTPRFLSTPYTTTAPSPPPWTLLILMPLHTPFTPPVAIFLNRVTFNVMPWYKS
jgi:hypothetical protein